jgi:hypothetical protein
MTWPASRRRTCGAVAGDPWTCRRRGDPGEAGRVRLAWAGPTDRPMTAHLRPRPCTQAVRPDVPPGYKVTHIPCRRQVRRSRLSTSTLTPPAVIFSRGFSYLAQWSGVSLDTNQRAPPYREVAEMPFCPDMSRTSTSRKNSLVAKYFKIGIQSATHD